MFSTLPLHDATLQSFHFKWADGRCVFELNTVDVGMRELVFSGVINLHVPRSMPWGPSVSVNSIRQVGLDVFEIELQSGDILKVQASGWQFGSKHLTS
jgi:hypothetical protein